MELNEIVSTYNRELRALKESMSLRFQDSLKGVFKEVFERHPNITKLTWTQYTPYFNDGEPCVFSVNDMTVFDDTVDEDDDEGLYLGWGEGQKRYPDLLAISRSLEAADDLLLEMFGDHCRVTITPKGIDVEEYEHE